MTTSPFLTLHELVKKARQKLNHDNWDYIVGGAETETTVRRNRLALDSIAFRPRVLRDVSSVDASTRFLGRALRLPVVLARSAASSCSRRKAAARQSRRPGSSASRTC